MKARLMLATVTLAALTTVAAACGGGGDDGAASASGTGGRLSLVAYSTPQEAYAKLIPAFQKTAAGKDVQFEESFGAAGDQSRAVEAGQKADIVEFALQSDMDRLVDADMVAKSWSQNQYH